LKRRIRTTLKITAEHAAHALHLLVAEGKIAAKDVTNALKRREALIGELRKRLGALEAGAMVKAKAGVKKGRGRRRQRKISAATRAKFRAQGRYMAAVRRLPTAARAKVKAIRGKSGIGAAIAAAKRMGQ
jgi:hypothetical protein